MIDNHRLRDIRNQAGNNGADIDAGKSDTLHEPDRQNKIHRALNKREVFILFENTGRGFEVGQNNSVSLEIQVGQNQIYCR